jgi:Asp-tRNA(Asn)/Glu-tRNA(Gln) amidotransferase A subunit family amidase
MTKQPEDVLFAPVWQQADLIRTRALSPVELMRATLNRIEAIDPTLRAWITVDADKAMDSARAAENDIARGKYLGPLHGIPYGIKDQIHALGFPTTLGTRVLTPDETVPPHDAAVVERLRDAGAILIGKQNLHEFGKGGTIDFPFGQPRNPWNIDYDASSSSSGSGIAPAAGMCGFSIGEDTGGSIRGPASCNGIVGLRPTYGRVSRFGGVMHAYTSDTLGPMARSVRDAAAVLQCIAGIDARDPLSSAKTVPDYTAQLTGDIKGMRLGVVREILYGDGTHPEVLAAMQEAIAVLKDAGAAIEEVSLPLAKWAVPLQFLSTDADAASWFLKHYLRDRYMKFDVGTRTRLAASAMIPATVYNRAMRARRIVRQQVLEVLSGYDALITPTNVIPPRQIEDARETVSDDPQDMVRRLLLRRISHYPFSLSNVPALSVPAGFSNAGLPLALQIVGSPFAEGTVFRIGDAYEQRTDWVNRHPDVKSLAARKIGEDA